MDDRWRKNPLQKGNEKKEEKRGIVEKERKNQGREKKLGRGRGVSWPWFATYGQDKAITHGQAKAANHGQVEVAAHGQAEASHEVAACSHEAVCNESQPHGLVESCKVTHSCKATTRGCKTTARGFEATTHSRKVVMCGQTATCSCQLVSFLAYINKAREIFFFAQKKEMFA